jgi:hypothetical protein
MDAPSLHEIQDLFAAGLGGDESSASRLVELIDGSYGAAPATRAEIYQRAYFLRLGQVLRADFPRTHELLGDDRFSSVARDYIRAHPSQHPSVTWFGRHFADFLAKVCFETQCAAESAHLEWLMIEAAYSSASPSVTIADLAAIEPRHWGELTFTPVASLRLCVTGWPVHRLWGGESSQSLGPRRTATRIWRKPNDLVAWAEMEEAEETALLRMLQGKPFDRIVEVFAHAPEAPRQAAALLGRWLGDGLLGSARLQAVGPDLFAEAGDKMRRLKTDDPAINKRQLS